MSDAQYLIPPPDWMPEWVVAPLIGGFSLADFLGIFVLLNFILFFVMFEIWLERKVGGTSSCAGAPSTWAPTAPCRARPTCSSC